MNPSNSRERKLIAYVNEAIERGGVGNVSISAPSLSFRDCERLRSLGGFSSVTREPFGYVRFGRKSADAIVDA